MNCIVVVSIAVVPMIKSFSSRNYNRFPKGALATNCYHLFKLRSERRSRIDDAVFIVIIVMRASGIVQVVDHPLPIIALCSTFIQFLFSSSFFLYVQYVFYRLVKFQSGGQSRLDDANKESASSVIMDAGCYAVPGMFYVGTHRHMVNGDQGSL